MSDFATLAPDMQEAVNTVARMSNAEFHRAAIALGLTVKQQCAAKPRKQRTAIVTVVPSGSTFAVQCGWCGWATSKPLTFHHAQLAAHNHNRHAHREHCVVDSKVA